MAEPDPLTDLFGLLAAPVAGTIRSVEQFRKGVDEFLKGVENFNKTMENLSRTAERVNVLLEEVEEPLRAAVPQVTRTVKAADQMMRVVSGPAMAAAPALERMAGIMSSPEVEQIPRQIQQFTEILGELSSRLTPLTQIAGTAGGLFGGLRIPGFSAPGDSEGKSAPPGPRVDTARRGQDDGYDLDDADPHPQHDPVVDIVTEPPLDEAPRRTPPPARISRTVKKASPANPPTASGTSPKSGKSAGGTKSAKSGERKPTKKTAPKSNRGKTSSTKESDKG